MWNLQKVSHVCTTRLGKDEVNIARSENMDKMQAEEKILEYMGKNAGEEKVLETKKHLKGIKEKWEGYG